MHAKAKNIGNRAPIFFLSSYRQPVLTIRLSLSLIFKAVIQNADDNGDNHTYVDKQYQHTVYLVVFACHKICGDEGKCTIFFFYVSHYMQFHDFLLSNNTNYHFFVLNILRAENIREKTKTRSSPKLTDIR